MWKIVLSYDVAVYLFIQPAAGNFNALTITAAYHPQKLFGSVLG